MGYITSIVCIAIGIIVGCAVAKEEWGIVLCGIIIDIFWIAIAYTLWG